MSQTTVDLLNKYGQSVWLDSLSRKMIVDGNLQHYIDSGVRGVIGDIDVFKKTLETLSLYDEKIVELHASSLASHEVYEALMIDDVQFACDLFCPVHEATHGLDGYVSFDISPLFVRDSEKTIAEALRLYKKVDRPNSMVKIVATPEGYPAVEYLIAQGIPVNVTHIFSIDQYESVAKAYIAGVKEFVRTGGDPARLRSVASVCAGAVDAAVDSQLAERIEFEEEASERELLRSLYGKAAVANSHMIYATHFELFSEPEFQKLYDAGARFQRILWCSTRTMNVEYNDLKYVTELIAKNTVNAMSEETLRAFLDHGTVIEGLSHDAESAKEMFNELYKNKVNIDDLCDVLLEKGLVAIHDAYTASFAAIEDKASL